MKITEKQRRFIDEYIATGNGSEACRRAGYSARSAYSQAEENLKKPHIKEEVKRRLAELGEARVADAREVLEHLSAVMRGEVTEQVATASGKRFELPVGERDRLRAAEMLLKVHGAFREQVELKVKATDIFMEAVEKVWKKREVCDETGAVD